MTITNELLNEIVTRIRLQPKQGRLWEYWDGPEYTQIGFGGSRGGTKSGGCRRCMILRRCLYPETTGVILRRVFPELEKSHILKFQQEFPELGQFYNEGKHRVTFPNGSILFFGSAQHARDLRKYFSAEFDDILVDEAQEFSQRELEQIEASNRSVSNLDIIPKTLYAFMPGYSEAGLPPIGLNYLKRVFVDGELNEQEKEKTWKFIQAFAWDNIEWCRKALAEDGIRCDAHRRYDPRCQPCAVAQEAEYYSWSFAQRRTYFITRAAYAKKLLGQSDKTLREAWLDGKWGTFEGQYFKHWLPKKAEIDADGETYEVSWHVVTREEAAELIKPYHFRWPSGDWGYEHPFCIHWHAIDELQRVITFREFWGRNMDEADLGRGIATRSGYRCGLHREFHKGCVNCLAAGGKWGPFPFSWDAGKRSKRSSAEFPQSIERRVNDELPPGLRTHPTDSSPASRIARARLLSAVLAKVIDGRPQWVISEDCPRLIECIPSLIRDPENPEDVLKVDYIEDQVLGDDAYDSAAAGLQYKLGRTVKPRELVQAEKLAKIEDPTHRHMEYLRMQAENKKANQPEVMKGDWRRRLEEQ